MNKLAPIVLTIPLAALGACGGDGGGSPVTNPPGGGPSEPPGEVPDTLLEGIWESSCAPAEPPATARRHVVSVFDDELLLIDVTYGSSSCDEGSAQREANTIGVFSEPVPEDGREIEDGLPIDIAVAMVALTPRIGVVAEEYNASSLCSATTMPWQVGVNQDVSNCPDAAVIGVDTSAPRTDYNLFLVDAAGTPDERADDTLRFGTLESQTDPARRPLTVSDEVIFTRRPDSP